MSGVLVHTYKNGQQAITKEVVQTSKSTVRPLSDTLVLHENMPSIKTPIAKGSKIIGGYLYHNVLVLAPNSESYRKITKKYSKYWVHPDLFATYLAKEGDDYPTKENLKEFAKKYRVGLIYLVGKNSSRLLDPISGQIVGKKSAEAVLPAQGIYPFFIRIETLLEDDESYYKLMDNL